MITTKPRVLPDIRSIADFDPSTDEVMRHKGRVFVVARDARMDTEVRPDEVRMFPVFCQEIAAVNDIAKLRHQGDMIAAYALMSLDGKRERLVAINQRIREIEEST